MPAHAIEARNLTYSRAGSAEVREVSFIIGAGTFTLLAGETGCGKNLLLRLLGLLERPDAGEVLVEGHATSGLDDEARDTLRSTRFGYVFAAPFLLPSFTAIENVAMPLFRISHVDPAVARVKTEELLRFVGLRELTEVPIGELPHAQQLRVSLARGLANEPAAVLVEDLDGALADAALRDFSALLRQACAQFGVAVVATASAEFVAAESDCRIEVPSMPREAVEEERL